MANWILTIILVQHNNTENIQGITNVLYPLNVTGHRNNDLRKMSLKFN